MNLESPTTNFHFLLFILTGNSQKVCRQFAPHDHDLWQLLVSGHPLFLQRFFFISDLLLLLLMEIAMERLQCDSVLKMVKLEYLSIFGKSILLRCNLGNYVNYL